MRGDLENLNFEAFNKLSRGLIAEFLEIRTTHIRTGQTV
jgi:hypothetical protein